METEYELICIYSKIINKLGVCIFQQIEYQHSVSFEEQLCFTLLAKPGESWEVEW